MSKILAALLLLLASSIASAACVVGAAGDTTAHLYIGAPVSNVDGSAVKLPITYTVYMGTASGAETLSGAGWTGSGVITGLTPGATYYFTLTATTPTGTSAKSIEQCKFITPGVAPTGSPPVAPRVGVAKNIIVIVPGGS
jgi:hypothetical protein